MWEQLCLAALEWLEEIEENQLAEQARQTLKNIEMGKEKTISWSEMQKRIGS